MSEGNYSKKWTYDGKNVASVAYVVDNSQICIERHNRTLGTLTSIDAGGSRVWSLLGEDETGRPATVGLGTLTLSHGFDPTGRVTAQKVSHSGRPDIQNAAYEYDCETGNMTMRTDSIYGHEEAFAYDRLNRLCEAGSDSYAYDTKGNMTSRGGVGDYVYDPASLTPYAPGEQPELTLGRGYGSHEHLDGFGLINMNARLYDPALCRFLSPDPVVQSPFTPQNLNRYAFCLNNPLRYTDPSGMVVKYENDDEDRLRDFIQELRRISKLFNQLFTYLNEDQDHDYFVGFEEQNNSDDNGQYYTATNRITFNKNNAIVTQVVSEEFYHAYQEMMKKMNQSSNWNREYEAKMASIMICAESGRPIIFNQPFYNIAQLIYFNANEPNLGYYATMSCDNFEELYLRHAPIFLDSYRNSGINHTQPIDFLPNTFKFFFFNVK